MAAKKVKAIVVDKNKMPTFSDRKKLMGSIREYGSKLSDDLAIASLGRNGTAQVADLMQSLRGICGCYPATPNINRILFGASQVMPRIVTQTNA